MAELGRLSEVAGWRGKIGGSLKVSGYQLVWGKGGEPEELFSLSREARKPV